MTYFAKPCPCGHPVCKNWFVEPVAAYQGVSFTEEQARAVAALLNVMEEKPMKRHKTRIYSIFGQIEGVVADEMVAAKGSKIKRVDFDSIPSGYRYQGGLKAVCALVMTKKEAREFERRVATLRA